MSIKDIYESQEHRINLSQFSALVKVAMLDGVLSAEEQKTLLRIADKLNITSEEYKQILKHPNLFPIEPAHTTEERLQRLFELFKLIYADHYMDAAEQKLILRYAIGMGCTSEKAEAIIKRSISIFQGGLDFEDYQYLLQKGDRKNKA